MERAGELTRNEKSVAILANKEGKAFLILCRSSDLSLDCNSLLEEAFVKFDGKGGGKPEFASGVIDLNRVEDALNFIEGKI
ncbi:MAG: DHH family phosphoesterase [Nitrososphaerales archaeon]